MPTWTASVRSCVRRVTVLRSRREQADTSSSSSCGSASGSQSGRASSSALPRSSRARRRDRPRQVSGIESNPKMKTLQGGMEVKVDEGGWRERDEA